MHTIISLNAKFRIVSQNNISNIWFQMTDIHF
jgi:hypothetical protein